MSNMCPACATNGWQKAFVAQDMYTGKPYEITRCLNCGMGRTVVDEALDVHQLHEVDGQADAGQRFGPTTELIMRYLRAYRAHEAERSGAVCGRLLDVGCGRGVFLDTMAGRGWEAYGTELNEAIAASAITRLGRRRIFTGPFESLPIPEGNFDLITMWHVLEHMDDPQAALEKCSTLLAPGGKLVIGVPNLDSIQAHMAKSRWLHLDVPRHRWHFTPTSLQQLAMRNGLNMSQEHYFSFEYGPYGLFQGVLSRAGLGTYLFTDILRRKEKKTLLYDPKFWLHAIGAPSLAVAATISLPLEYVNARLKRGGCMTMVFGK